GHHAASALVAVCPALSKVKCAPAAEVEVGKEKRSEHDCLVYGHRFRHGEVFSIPGYSHCLRYLCQHGGWTFHQEGSTFSTRDCVTTYEVLLKTNNWYQAKSIETCLGGLGFRGTHSRTLSAVCGRNVGSQGLQVPEAHSRISRVSNVRSQGLG
ncbi:hypothetical protein RRG08_006106, partial [Elysia crispata]